MTALTIAPSELAYQPKTIVKPRPGAPMSEWNAYWAAVKASKPAPPVKPLPVETAKPAPKAPEVLPKTRTYMIGPNIIYSDHMTDDQRKALAEIIKSPTYKARVIMTETGRLLGLSLTDLKSGRRDSKTSYARHLAIYLVRLLTTLTKPEIGKIFGGRDHTTIYNGIERIRLKLQCDPVTRANVDKLIEMIRLKIDISESIIEGQGLISNISDEEQGA